MTKVTIYFTQSWSSCHSGPSMVTNSKGFQCTMPSMGPVTNTFTHFASTFRLSLWAKCLLDSGNSNSGQGEQPEMAHGQTPEHMCSFRFLLGHLCPVPTAHSLRLQVPGKAFVLIQVHVKVSILLIPSHKIYVGQERRSLFVCLPPRGLTQREQT